uniref:Uncharacterized protein n=1 Tax=Sphaerodactylus townsendi TaxID=933632 RepID=A0ACB8GCB7_9SAUR
MRPGKQLCDFKGLCAELPAGGVALSGSPPLGCRLPLSSARRLRSSDPQPGPTAARRLSRGDPCRPPGPSARLFSAAGKVVKPINSAAGVLTSVGLR